MRNIALTAGLLWACGASATLAQDLSNLAVPYRFRLPFLEAGEYVISAFGGHNSSEQNTQWEDVPAKSVTKNDNSWFDLNGVVALSNQFLIGAELTVYPKRTTRDFNLSGGNRISEFSYEDEVTTHVAQEYLFVFRPVEQLEVFASYFQDMPSWARTNSVSDPFNAIGFSSDIKDFRSGVTYFGKF